MTTELQVQTITFQPAKVEFNFDQLSAVLDENLKKYAGLEFTEKTAGDCKKTIAELRKGKTLLDTYRKDTKKQLTESITDFEDQCKQLAAKFDAVIGPLTQQHDQFEHDRKERKRQEIQAIIDALIAEQGLLKKYANQLVIPEEYLNKGKSIKDIKAELTARAESLGISQDKDEADERLVRTQVELANAQYGVELVDGTYIGLLEHKSVDAIIESVKRDASDLKQRKESRTVTEPTKLNNAPVASPADSKAELFVDTYEITGTEEQLAALDEYLEGRGLQYKIL